MCPARKPPPDPDLERPSPRELELLELLAEGLNMPQAAERMGLTLNTVKTVNERLRWRLNARSEPHAVAIALRKGYMK